MNLLQRLLNLFRARVVPPPMPLVTLQVWDVKYNSQSYYWTDNPKITLSGDPQLDDGLVTYAYKDAQKNEVQRNTTVKKWNSVAPQNYQINSNN